MPDSFKVATFMGAWITTDVVSADSSDRLIEWVDFFAVQAVRDSRREPQTQVFRRQVEKLLSANKKALASLVAASRAADAALDFGSLDAEERELLESVGSHVWENAAKGSQAVIAAAKETLPAEIVQAFDKAAPRYVQALAGIVLRDTVMDEFSGALASMTGLLERYRYHLELLCLAKELQGSTCGPRPFPRRRGGRQRPAIGFLALVARRLVILGSPAEQAYRRVAGRVCSIWKAAEEGKLGETLGPRRSYLFTDELAPRLTRKEFDRLWHPAGRVRGIDALTPETPSDTRIELLVERLKKAAKKIAADPQLLSSAMS